MTERQCVPCALMIAALSLSTLPTGGVDTDVHTEPWFQTGEARLYPPILSGQGHWGSCVSSQKPWCPGNLVNTHLSKGRPRVLWSCHDLSFWLSFIWHLSASSSHLFSPPGRFTLTEIPWIPPAQSYLSSCVLASGTESLNRTWIVSVCLCVCVSRGDRSCFLLLYFLLHPFVNTCLPPIFIYVFILSFIHWISWGEIDRERDNWSASEDVLPGFHEKLTSGRTFWWHSGFHDDWGSHF